jgi:hypothetical protein
VDFFTCNFFYFSTLGATAAPKALVRADLLAASRVCLNEAIVTGMKVNACPSIIATVSFPTVSSTLCLACFGFGELGLQNQEKGEN